MTDLAIKTKLNKLSIIIPVLNEENTLPRLINSLKSQLNIQLDIIVIDGGSTDNSLLIAQELGARTIKGEKGRAKQLNIGARAAKYTDLLFLHADSNFEGKYFIVNAYHYWKSINKEHVAGHFQIEFMQTTDRYKKPFHYLSQKSATNRRYTINGDQGLLIGKQYFESLGAYDETFPFMEDQAIAEKIFDTGCWLLLPGMLKTSGRRFEVEGFHRRYILMSLMMGLYWTGAYEFFDRARNVYVDQQRTEKLKLWPFFRCIWHMLFYDFGLKRSLVQWYKVGRFVRLNSWQVFFYIDVRFYRRRANERSFSFLKVYENVIFPLTNNVFFNVLMVPFIFCWTMLILGPLFYFMDE